MPRIGLFILLLPLFGMGQQKTNPTPVPDPPYMNVIYSWSSDTLAGLEKTACQVKNKLKALGFGGASMVYVMDGPRSPIRVKAGASMRFAVKLGGMIDPSAMIRLYRFDSQRKTREAAISSQPGKEQVDFNVQHGTNDTYVLVTAALLPPGEYGFVNMMQASGGGMQMSYTAYAFGIDP